MLNRAQPLDLSARVGSGSPGFLSALRTALGFLTSAAAFSSAPLSSATTGAAILGGRPRAFGVLVPTDSSSFSLGVEGCRTRLPCPTADLGVGPASVGRAGTGGVGAASSSWMTTDLERLRDSERAGVAECGKVRLCEEKQGSR